MKKDKVKENSKDRILDVATKLFALKGFDSVSIREICKESNVNISMISYFFGGKKELYKAIIDRLIDQQNKLISEYTMQNDFNLDNMTRDEKIEFLTIFMNKAIDYLYSSNIPDDLVNFLLREQHNHIVSFEIPSAKILKKVIASIIGKKETDNEAVLDLIFLISQVNSPRVFPAFSLRTLGQDNFTQEDIKIIRENLKIYIEAKYKKGQND